MKKACVAVAVLGVYTATLLALHPTYIPEGGYLQACSIVLLSFASGVLATLVIE